MSLFTKKEKNQKVTIQDCEQNFSKLQFELGAITYLIDLKTQELNKLNDQLNEMLEDMKKWAHRGSLLTNKAKNELNDTIRQGEKNEGALN